MVLQPRRTHRRFAPHATSSAAFHLTDSVDTPKTLISRLKSPAHLAPYQRFATPSRNANAWLEATAGRYPFGAEHSQLLLHAGSSRRFPMITKSVTKPCTSRRNVHGYATLSVILSRTEAVQAHDRPVSTGKPQST